MFKILILLCMVVLSASLIANENETGGTEKSSYIVQFDPFFNEDTDTGLQKLQAHLAIEYDKIYRRAILGVTMDLTSREASLLESLEYIKSVERDAIVSPTISWGQDRIDQTSLPLDSSYSPPSGGDGVNLYIIDTGINVSHDEFSGRVGQVVSVVAGGTADCVGHGTHVASIAAGESYGVAYEATINSIRISNNCTDGYSSSSAQLDAMEWVIDNAEPNSVVNLSYETSGTATKVAINNVIKDGHVFVTAGGNDDTDPCIGSTTPDHPDKPYAAIKVVATESDDSRWGSSNYGDCYNIFAPGSGIEAAYYASNTGTVIYSGTSMASPFIAGIATIYRELYPSADPMEVNEAIIDSATTGQVTDTLGTPNRLAYVDASPPSAYWQPTTSTSVNPGPQVYLPPPGCTTGQQWLVAIAHHPMIPGQWINRVWECQ